MDAQGIFSSFLDSTIVLTGSSQMLYDLLNLDEGREASLFMGWGAPNYGNRYNTRESPYFCFIFTGYTTWPLKNLK